MGESPRMAPHARQVSSNEADVLSGLRRLGVPAAEARRAVAEAAASGADDIETLLRTALLILRRTTYASVGRSLSA